MKTDKLENSLRLLDYCFTGDETFMGELIISGSWMESNLARPFREELKENLSETKTNGEIIDMITFYFNKFKGVVPFFLEHKDVIFNGTLYSRYSVENGEFDAMIYGHQSSSGEKKILNKIERYAVYGHSFFIQLFCELKYALINRGLIFKDVCRDLGFPWEILQAGTTVINRELWPNVEVARPKAHLQTLFDIWLPANGNKNYYYKVIDLLKEEHLSISGPFVTEIDKKLFWNQNPKSGWRQYMAGFIYTCIEKKWILDEPTAPKWVKIMQATFNVPTFNSAPFKGLSGTPPSDEYLKPFKKIAENSK